MNRLPLLSLALAATLATACSTTPPTTQVSSAPVVGVNATPATSPTLSSGLNTQTATERIGEPAQAPLVTPPAPALPAGNVAGGAQAGTTPR